MHTGKCFEEGYLPFGVAPGIAFNQLLNSSDRSAAPAQVEELPVADAPHPWISGIQSPVQEPAKLLHQSVAENAIHPLPDAGV